MMQPFVALVLVAIGASVVSAQTSTRPKSGQASAPDLGTLEPKVVNTSGGTAGVGAGRPTAPGEPRECPAIASTANLSRDTEALAYSKRVSGVADSALYVLRESGGGATSSLRLQLERDRSKQIRSSVALLAAARSIAQLRDDFDVTPPPKRYERVHAPMLSALDSLRSAADLWGRTIRACPDGPGDPLGCGLTQSRSWGVLMDAYIGYVDARHRTACLLTADRVPVAELRPDLSR